VRRAAVIAFAALLLLIAVALADPELRSWIRYRREYRRTPEFMGFVIDALGYRPVNRWTGEPAGPFVYWHRETGDVVLVFDRRSDGTVRGQLDPSAITGRRERSGPPARDAASAPWLAEGITADEWWARVNPDR